MVKDRPLFLRITHEDRSWSLYGPTADDSRMLVVGPGDRISWLEIAEVNPLLEEGAAIRVPLFDNDAPSGTGDLWSFDGAEAFQGVRFRWWCDGPPKWKPLTDWIRRLAEFLDADHQ